MGEIRLRRAYDPPEAGDGYRVLVDRLWRRGRTKGELALDVWRKDLAPSTGLRRWFGHDPARWPEFARRFLRELEAGADPGPLLERGRAGTVTPVYGAKDGRHDNAVVRREYLARGLGARA